MERRLDAKQFAEEQGPARCENPWERSLIYIYCSVTALLALIAVIGMMTTAYNRNGTSRRRVYPGKYM